jgi:D-alanyl-lipoteichoic acid acyltransferase DltB (MBOAT superfamily)
MTFNSFPFIFLFLPLAVAGYFLCNRVADRKWGKLWLLALSLVFMGASRPDDLWLLVASVGVNCFVASRLVERRGLLVSPKTLLGIAITSNILFLCYFKYSAFFVQTLNAVSRARLTVPHSTFPLGISFYTIYQVMFLVDCYEGLIEEHNWLDHFTFASLFTHVTMGPIVRWNQLVPQLNDPSTRHLNTDNLATGLYIFVVGLFKKVVLADSFFRWADAGFSYNHPLSLAGGWITALAFTFQLYFDFSGYTDMAIGAGLMLNLKLPENFNRPFRSRSIVEFWRRWHITLTNFITGYLYTPMARSMRQVTFAKAMLATFTAMVIAGFWHGASWTFIIFGALHGVALVLNQCWKKMKLSMPDYFAWVSSFIFVVVSLVVFRSSSVAQAGQILGSMISARGGILSYDPWSGIDRVDQVMGVAWMLLGLVIVCRPDKSMEVARDFRPSWATVAVTIFLATVSAAYVNGVVSRSFIYRDF